MSINNISQDFWNSPSMCSPSFHVVRFVKEAKVLLQEGHIINERNSQGQTALTVQINNFFKNPQDNELKEIVAFLVIHDPHFKELEENNNLLKQLIDHFDGYVHENRYKKNNGEALENYLELICIFIENGFEKNLWLEFLMEEMFSWIGSSNQVIYEYTVRLLKTDIKLEVFDPYLDNSRLFLKEIVEKYDQYDRYHPILKLLVAKGLKIYGLGEIFYFHLFNRAINNLINTNDNISLRKKSIKVIEDFIDLSGGIAAIYNNPKMECFTLKETIKSREQGTQTAVVNKEDLYIKHKDNGVYFISQKGLYLDIVNKILDRTHRLKTCEHATETDYCSREGLLEFYELIASNDPHANGTWECAGVKSWKYLFNALKI